MNIKVALCGNPNSGKTTLFNVLTGSTAHVGNWPGVTVDKKEGKYKKGGKDIRIIDLPGIYSLSPYTPEEVVSRDYIIDEEPDVILNIVDATNIVRNLYLTTQVLEMSKPVVIALNMMDVLEKEGHSIDIKSLEQELGVPVVSISASKETGMDELMKAIEEAAGQIRKPKIIFPDNMGQPIDEIVKILEEKNIKQPVFTAIKLLDNDDLMRKKIGKDHQLVNEVIKNFEHENEVEDMEALIADLRYKYITNSCFEFFKKNKMNEVTASDKIDKVLTHKYLGIPIFLGIMYLMFHFTFSGNVLGTNLESPGVALQTLVCGLWDDGLVPAVSNMLESAKASDVVSGIVVDGVLAGVGAVLSFVPQIMVLFLFLSLLEDSGYMARAAFIMDRALRKFGLSGKSFVPMLMGFGCSVPGIMATRTLENEKDRRITMMLIPYMSCGAKMPIYAMFAATLFTKANHADLVVFFMYLLGIVVALIAGVILKNTVFKSEPAPFIMELPNYHAPKLKNLVLHLWEKLKDYVVRAGTIIAAASIVIWVLSSFTFGFKMVDANSADSMLGVIGSAIVFIFQPLGFANGTNAWMAVVAVLTGLIAKEAVVSTMSVLYAGGAAGAGFLVAISTAFTPLSAVSFMAFNLLSVPCMAAVAALKAEMKSTKWFWFTISFWIITAWIVSFLIYNIGTLLGF